MRGFIEEKWEDFIQAVVFFTCLPVGKLFKTGATSSEYLPRPLSLLAWSFPLVGLFIALLSLLPLFVIEFLTRQTAGLPDFIPAALVLFAIILISGALHEDGLADVADSLVYGASTERKLEIMRDSKIGVYGVLALIFSVLVRFMALYSLFERSLTEDNPGLVLLAVCFSLVLSRYLILVAMFGPGVVKPGGKSLGYRAGRASFRVVWLWFVLICALSFMVLGSILILFPPLLAGFCAYLFMRAHIGGMSGDAYGFVEQITQIVSFVTCAIFLL